MSSSETNGAPASADQAEPAPLAQGRLQRARLPIMIGVVLLVLLIGLLVYLQGGRVQTTDDAQVKGARVSISSSLSGRVVSVKVREGQYVHAGDVLFQLDGRPLQVAYAEAQASLANARSEIEGLQATYRQRLDDIKAAQDNLTYLEGEAARQKALVAAGTASGAQRAAADSDVLQARQKLAAAREQAANALALLGGNPHQPVERNAQVLQARARLEEAGLNRSYIDIVAPQDGQVTKVDQLEAGDYVTAAAPVFSLVSPRLWVEANFKENQLEYVKPGQRVTIKIDAYPDRIFEARVASISPGTGSSFSVLPAENATGNWVKVTQRVPVTIDFSGAIDAPLRAGLSATVKIYTDHHRRLFGAEKPVSAPARP